MFLFQKSAYLRFIEVFLVVKQEAMLKHCTLTFRNKVYYLIRSIVTKCPSPPLQWCSPAKQFAKFVDKKFSVRGTYNDYIKKSDSGRLGSGIKRRI